jgi:CheY-like chemotaxis protein
MKIVTPVQQTFSVLFVDDDADEFYLFNEAIEQSFIPVSMTRAKDGSQLLKVLNSNEIPDVILMDLNMPYKDGIETLTEIKANHNFKNIPVIIFSTSKNLSQINSCYQKGASFYVVKPETFDDITKVVKKVFSINWKEGSYQPSRENFVLEY